MGNKQRGTMLAHTPTQMKFELAMVVKSAASMADEAQEMELACALCKDGRGDCRRWPWSTRRAESI
jgi:hypothetical protein